MTIGSTVLFKFFSNDMHVSSTRSCKNLGKKQTIQALIHRRAVTDQIEDGESYCL